MNLGNKNEVEDCIKILESIRERSANHISIVRELFESYLAIKIPMYEKAFLYAQILEDHLDAYPELRNVLAEFYINWSVNLKQKIEYDPFKEKLRIQKYRELAKKSFILIEKVQNKSHKEYYILARSKYSNWDDKGALKYIDKAIGTLEDKTSTNFHLYSKFRSKIVRNSH